MEAENFVAISKSAIKFMDPYGYEKLESGKDNYLKNIELLRMSPERVGHNCYQRGGRELTLLAR